VQSECNTVPAMQRRLVLGRRFAGACTDARAGTSADTSADARPAAHDNGCDDAVDDHGEPDDDHGAVSGTESGAHDYLLDESSHAQAFNNHHGFYLDDTSSHSDSSSVIHHSDDDDDDEGCGSDDDSVVVIFHAFHVESWHVHDRLLGLLQAELLLAWQGQGGPPGACL
jgi:hypothetical protein